MGGESDAETCANIRLTQLEQAIKVAERDTKDASAAVLKDLRRFQQEKENDLRRYMVSHILSFARSKSPLLRYAHGLP